MQPLFLASLPPVVSEIIVGLRETPERVVLFQDGDVVQAGNLLEKYERVRQQLSKSLSGRVALRSSRADSVAACLLACCEQTRELILLRTANEPPERELDSLKVALLFDDSLHAIWAGGGTGHVSDRAALLIATSGTTGTPKIALHPFEKLLGRIPRANTLSQGARWLLTYHPASFAGLQVILTAVASAAPLIAVQHGSINGICEAAVRHSPTHVSGTPTFWRAFLLALRSEAANIPLKQITIGGEAVDQLILDQLHNAFPNARIIHIYASTEAGALFSVTDGRAGFPAKWLENGIEGIQLRIRDGGLEVVSPRATLGYVGGQPLNLTEDAWLITGDLVEREGDRVFFCGRADDMINVGGAKVMPEEVENALRTLPFVKEIRVFGRPNPIVGALVWADIVLSENMAEQEARSAILQFASSRLERHKVPRVLNFVAQIPVNASGKKTRR
jgi:acyl-coenzyme A synthetase/AMP-(fatty) acid ligase